jgi:hypothetical protein
MGNGLDDPGSIPGTAELIFTDFSYEAHASNKFTD